MKNKKLSPITITIISIVILGCIFYATNIIKKRSTDADFLLKERCAQKGQDAYNEYSKGVKNDPDMLNTTLSPEYTYNKKLNTCLVATGFIGDSFLEKVVIDSLENKKILMFAEVNIKGQRTNLSSEICPECIVSLDEFERKKKELFGE